MKRSFILLVGLTGMAILADTASAQETKIGNGRLLRKWRDDIFGAPDSRKEQPAANRKQPIPQNSNSRQRPYEHGQGQPQGQPQAAGNQRIPGAQNGFRQPFANQQRQPTPAQPRSTSVNPGNPDPRYMSEAQRHQQLYHQESQRQQSAQYDQQRRQPSQTEPDYYRQRNQELPQNGAMRNPSATNQTRQSAQRQATPAQRYQPQMEPTPARRPDYAKEPAFTQPMPPSSHPQMTAQAKATHNAKKRGPRAVGFGFELKVDKEDQIYIADLDRNGNAAAAGLKKGDIIVEIGGSKLIAIEEFDEISKVMNDGDQLEIKISRRGRVSEVQLQFGEADETPEIQQGDASPEFETQYQPARQRDSVGGYDFVPESRRSGGSGIVVNPGLLDKPTPPRSNNAPTIPSLEIDLESQLPSRN